MSASHEDLATPEQLEQLRALLPDSEEIPDGMRSVEANQRLTELRAQSDNT